MLGHIAGLLGLATSMVPGQIMNFYLGGQLTPTGAVVLGRTSLQEKRYLESFSPAKDIFECNRPDSGIALWIFR